MPQAHDRAQRGGLAGAVAAQQHRELARAAPRGRRRAGCGTRRCACARRSVRAGSRSCRPPSAPRPGRPPARSARRSPRPARHRPPAVPLCSTMMRSASSRTTSILCSTSRMVLLLSFLSVRIRSRITGASAAFMPAVGSSNMKTLRLQRHQQRHLELALVAVRQARHRARRACRPGAPSPGSRRRAAVSARWSLQMLHRLSPRRCAPSRVACTARRTFSSTVRFGKQIGELEGAAQPRARARRRAAARRASSPVERHRARARRELAGDQVEVGGLAGAVGADDRGQRAGLRRRRTRVRPPRGRRSGSSGPGFRAWVDSAGPWQRSAV